MITHDLVGDDDLVDVISAGHVEHDVEQDLFQDGAQTSGTRASCQCLLGHLVERLRREVQLNAVELEQALVLLDQRVLRLRQHSDQRCAIELRHSGEHRQSTDELRDQAEAEEILGHHVAEDVVRIPLGAHSLTVDQIEGEAQLLLAEPLLDDVIEAGEGTAHDEEHVRGVDLDELLVGMLAAALGGHRRRRALENLQERLLHALAGDIAGDRRVLALAGDLVDLIDVDDARLGPLDVIVGRLDQLQQDVLDILTHIAGLGERGGVGNGERDVEHAREGLGQQRLARACGPEQQDVRLRQLDPLVLAALGPALLRLDPLVVVVDRN